MQFMNLPAFSGLASGQNPADQADESQAEARLRRTFNTEEACAQALAKARWPDGFRCPRCLFRHSYYIATRRLYQCAFCRYQASVTAGTVMERTRTELTKWFLAFFLVARNGGINAKQLQGEINVTYKTAWTMLSKIRYALHEENRTHPLTGMVQINSAIFGFRSYDITRLDRAPGLRPVLIAGSVDPQFHPRQIKIKQIVPPQFLSPQQNGIQLAKRMTKPVLMDFLEREADALQATILQNVHPLHFRAQSRPLRKVLHEAERWVRLRFHGIRAKHFQAYMDEFCFRYNARANLKTKSHARAIWRKFLAVCAGRRCLTYRQITRLHPLQPANETCSYQAFASASIFTDDTDDFNVRQRNPWHGLS